MPHHLLEGIALAGIIGLGAYELYHLERYGTLGFGNPYNNASAMGGYDAPYGTQYGAQYGTQYGYGNPTFGHHHGHHHHHMY